MFGTLMDKTISLSRAAVTKDAGGGNLRSFSTVATGITASIQPAKGSDIDAYSRRQIDIDSMIYTEYDFSVSGLKLGDVFIDAGGQSYVVKSGVLPKSNLIISGLPLYQIACKSVVV